MKCSTRTTGFTNCRTDAGPLNDVTKRAEQTWLQVLINSSNIGMAQGTARMSFREMREAVLRFGFGSKTDIGLPGESAGIVTNQRNWSDYTQTSVAMGHEVAVTPRSDGAGVLRLCA